MKQEELLKQNPKKTDKKEMAFITGFNLQYKSVEKGIKKYWPILLRDKTHFFIYKKAPGLKNLIAKNVINPPKKEPHSRKGMGSIDVEGVKGAKPLQTTKER